MSYCHRIADVYFPVMFQTKYGPSFYVYMENNPAKGCL